jgi:alkylhydroperoxidase family enzyme
MSRLPMLPPEPDSPALQGILADLRRTAGPAFELPNLYRILAISPPMFRAWIDFAWPLRLQATSARKLRELLILRGAQVCEARYEWAHHVPMALDAGLTRQQIDALHRWREADCFDGQQQAILRMAEEISEGPAASAEAIAALRASGFADEQVVELVLTASFYVCVARFLASMDIPLEDGYDKYLDGGDCRLPASFVEGGRP